MHGFSLRSLYRRCANSLTESSKDNLHSTIHTKMKHTLIPNSPHASNQPCILIIRTSTNEVSFATSIHLMMELLVYFFSGEFHNISQVSLLEYLFNDLFVESVFFWD